MPVPAETVFADPALAARIEAAEAALMRAMVRAIAGARVHELGTGVATFVRDGSPMNKVIGVGLGDAVDVAALDRQLGERIEICTLAAPEMFELLANRGYRLVGFENVLARRIDAIAAPSPATAVRVEPADGRFRDVLLDGAAAPDDTGVPVDVFTRDQIASAIDDSLHAPVSRYLAFVEGVPAGAASMGVDGGIAVLTGSATLRPFRRRGVQAALLARRLHDARAAGADVAVITTAPGSQSQANVMKLGFSLVYARAIMVLPS